MESWKELLSAAALAIAVAMGAALVGTGPLEAFGQNPVAVTGALITLLVSLAPLVVRIATGRFDIFEPIIGGSLMLGLLFGVRPLIAIHSRDFNLYPGYSAAAALDDAVMLGMAGTITFIAGYAMAARRTAKQRIGYSADSDGSGTRLFNCERVTIYGVTLFATALGLFALYVGRVGGIGSLLRGRNVDILAIQSSEYFSAAPVAIACVAALWVLARHGQLTKNEKWLVAALAILAAASFVLVGDRRFIIPCLALPLVVGYLIADRRPRNRNLLLLLPLSIVVLATIPFARAEGARQQAGGLVPIFTQAFKNPALAISRVLDGPDTEMVHALGVQVDHQRRTGRFYFGRATVGDGLLAPVPSLLVPDKPQTARNQLLSELFGKPCTTVAGGRCPDFSVVGTFYQDFWWPGVLVGMFAFGAAVGRLWRQFQLRPTNSLLALAVAMSTIFVPIIIRAGVMPASAWTLYLFVPTLLGILWTSRLVSGHSHRQATD